MCIDLVYDIDLVAVFGHLLVTRFRLKPNANTLALDKTVFAGEKKCFPFCSSDSGGQNAYHSHLLWHYGPTISMCT